jgi:DNA-binding NtrC family response regulator
VGFHQRQRSFEQRHWDGAVISLPPLREFRDDVPLLVQRFLSRSEKPVTIRQDALDRILSYDWPGNVRELENVITRAIVLAPDGVITPDSIQFADSGRSRTDFGWTRYRSAKVTGTSFGKWKDT